MVCITVPDSEPHTQKATSASSARDVDGTNVRSTALPLAGDQRRDVVERVEMIDVRLMGRNGNAELLLEERHQLQSGNGVQNAPGDQWRVVLKLVRILARKNSRRINSLTVVLISSGIAHSFDDELLCLTRPRCGVRIAGRFRHRRRRVFPALRRRPNRHGQHLLCSASANMRWPSAFGCASPGATATVLRSAASRYALLKSNTGSRTGGQNPPSRPDWPRRSASGRPAA